MAKGGRARYGPWTAVVGQSGSGKSTMMNVLGCLDIPTRGTYLLGGTDVRELTDKELSHIRNKQIGFIFQQYNLIQSLTVLENVELPLIYQGVNADDRRDMALEALARVGLANRIKHRPVEMSGGQQQRVAIARAIATKPPIIMADEPTGALDSHTGQEVLKFLQELNKEGSTVILITHDIDLAIHIADSIAIFHDGRIIETADTSTFTGDGEGLKHPYSRALFAALPQNGFRLDVCPRCGACSATWEVDEAGMRCNCEHT